MKKETTQNQTKPIDEALADIPRGRRSSQVSTATRQGFSAKGEKTMSNSGNFSSFEKAGWNAGENESPETPIAFDSIEPCKQLDNFPELLSAADALFEMVVAPTLPEELRAWRRLWNAVQKAKALT